MNFKDATFLRVVRSRRALKVFLLLIFLFAFILVCSWTGLGDITDKLEGKQFLIWGITSNRNNTDSLQEGTSDTLQDAIEIAREHYYNLLDQSLKQLHLMPMENEHSKTPSLYSGPSGLSKDMTTAKSTYVNSYLTAAETNEKDMCSQMRFGKGVSKHNTEIKFTEARQLGRNVDTEAMKRYLDTSGYGEEVPKIDTSNMKDDRWYRFAGSAIWLEDQQCFFEVDRVMYAPESRSVPWLSLIWMQLFDKDFNEIRDRRLRFTDLSGEEVESVLSELNKVNETANFDEMEKILDRISIKFPTVMDISFVTEDFGRPQGPEDPRIIATLNKKGDTEPVVIFNQINEHEKVAIYAAHPLRRNGDNAKHGVPTVQFNFKKETNLELKSIEKNWMPFIEDSQDADKISFIYELDPLAILNCNLDDGLCIMAQKGQIELTDLGTTVSLRGGANFMAIPDSAIKDIFTKEQIANHKVRMWVSFLKYHGWKSGCGSSTYRPALVVLIKVDSKYRIDLMSGAFDFGIDVLTFDGKSTKCDDPGPNVLSPNSIPFWKLTKIQEKKKREEDEESHPKKGTTNENDNERKEKKEKTNFNSPKYNDLMALTVSEADRNVKVLYIGNIMNYLIGSFKKSAGGKLRSFGEDTPSEMVEIEKCAVSDFLEYCKEYAKAH